MNDAIKFKVDGIEVEGKKGEMVLAVLLREGFDIPHLCYHEAVSPYASCRLCIVEVSRNGRKRIATSCNHPVMEGIEIQTKTEKIQKLRRITMELLLAFAPASKGLQKTAEQMGIKNTRFSALEPQRDCILCGLCERVCREIVGVNAISFVSRGGNKLLSPPFMEASEECIACGACVYVCPSKCIELIQTDKARIINRWGRIVALSSSKKSNIPFAPKPQLDYFAKLVGLPSDFFDIAPGERNPQHE